MKKLILVTLFLSQVSVSTAYAWGRRGHETVGSLAARLLAEKNKDTEFLSNHSYDLGFYNNVPDIVWKSDPETYKKEFVQHFMDMEEFAEVKDIKWSQQRVEFFKKYSNIPKTAGRSWWRVQELYSELEKISKSLKQKNITTEEHHKRQLAWLLHAGVIGHYISDLAQPLHVTSNYDGKMTNQKGIHKWFEETVIDYLYPQIQNSVYQQAMSQWAEFHKKNKSKSVFELCQILTKDSQKFIEPLLDIDKKAGRKSLSKASEDYKQLAIDRLTVGTLYLAEIWSRQTGWKYKGDRFFLFDTKPNYIEPKVESKVEFKN